MPLNIAVKNCVRTSKKLADDVKNLHKGLTHQQV